MKHFICGWALGALGAILVGSPGAIFREISWEDLFLSALFLIGPLVGLAVWGLLS